MLTTNGGRLSLSPPSREPGRALERSMLSETGKPMSKKTSSIDCSKESSGVSNERVPRRRFSLERKLAILAEAERCATPEQVIALLTRERLHDSQLTLWRKQFEKSKALREDSKVSIPKRTNRTAELSRSIGQLEREKTELERQL